MDSRKLIFIMSAIISLYFSLCVYGEDSINYNALFNKDGRLSSRMLIDKAWSAVKNERYDSAAAYYTIVASRYSEDAPRDEIIKAATASVNIGYIWLSWRMNSQEAYPWLQRAHEIAVRHNINEVEIGVDSNLGQLYFNYGNYSKALDHFWKAVKRIMDNKLNLYFTKGLMEFAAAAVLHGNDSVIAGGVKVLKTYGFNDTVPMASYAHKLIVALDRYVSNRSKEGAIVLENAESLLITDTDLKRYLTMHNFILGKMLAESGDLKSAIFRIRQGVSISLGEDYYNLVEKGYKELHELYKLKGDNDSAAFFQNKMFVIRDSLFNVGSFEVIKDMSMAAQLSSLTENTRKAQQKAAGLKRILFWICISVIVALGLLLLLYANHKKIKIAYRDLYRKNMELIRGSKLPAPSEEAAAKIALEKTNSQDIDMVEANRLFQKVNKFVTESAEIYDVDFSLDKLSDMIGEKSRFVSRSINIVTGKNFSTFLSEIRIKEACKRLSNLDNLRIIKIESVAESVGYRSRTYFSRVFKEVTGLTPSQFVNQMKEEAKTSKDCDKEV